MATTYEDVVELVQTIYDGGLAHTLQEKYPAYSRLDANGRVEVKNKTVLRWLAVEQGHGNASRIADGATLPDATQEEYEAAALQYAIYIKTVRVGRMQRMGSKNNVEFFKTAEGADLLAQQVNRGIPQVARTINADIVSATSPTNGLTGFGDAVAKTTNTYAGINRTTATYWRPYVNTAGANRTLTEALMRDMYDNLVDNRESQITEVWVGTTAWNALETLLRGLLQVQNLNPEELRGGALRMWWKGIPFIRMRDMAATSMWWLDMESDDGITLYRQHEQDFLLTPEGTNSYDDRMSIAAHMQLVINNPWKQGALEAVN